MKNSIKINKDKFEKLEKVLHHFLENHINVAYDLDLIIYIKNVLDAIHIAKLRESDYIAPIKRDVEAIKYVLQFEITTGIFEELYDLSYILVIKEDGVYENESRITCRKIEINR